MKPERTQFDLSLLDGWVPIHGPAARAVATDEPPESLWTALEMPSHLAACEIVAELGRIAEQHAATPDLDVRGNIVFITVGAQAKRITEADFHFAQAVDAELGDGTKSSALVTH